MVNGCGLTLISDREKIAWVFGYLKANFDIFVEQGANANQMSDTLQALTIEVLKLLGIKDVMLVNHTIMEIDSIDMELAVRRALQKAEDESDGKRFTAVF